MLKIGEFARLAGLSIDTLYHYEKKNILVPSDIDRFTGYRSYDASQLVTVNKLLALKDAGLSLDEIAKTLQSNPPVPALVDLLESKALALEAELNRETKRLERLHTNIFLIKNNGIPLANEITVKQVAPILVASIRKTFDKARFDSELEIMWAELNRTIDESGGKRTIPCMMLYHKGWVDYTNGADTGSQPLDVEVIEPMIKPIDGSETVKVYTLPAVERMACAIHQGAFQTMPETIKALYDWIRGNGYTVSGALREIYHKGAWATDDPGEYITELQIPLA